MTRLALSDVSDAARHLEAVGIAEFTSVRHSGKRWTVRLMAESESAHASTGESVHASSSEDADASGGESAHASAVGAPARPRSDHVRSINQSESGAPSQNKTKTTDRDIFNDSMKLTLHELRADLHRRLAIGRFLKSYREDGHPLVAGSVDVARQLWGMITASDVRERTLGELFYGAKMFSEADGRPLDSLWNAVHIDRRTIREKFMKRSA